MAFDAAFRASIKKKKNYNINIHITHSCITTDVYINHIIIH